MTDIKLSFSGSTRADFDFEDIQPEEITKTIEQTKIINTRQNGTPLGTTSADSTNDKDEQGADRMWFCQVHFIKSPVRQITMSYRGT